MKISPLITRLTGSGGRWLTGLLLVFLVGLMSGCGGSSSGSGSTTPPPTITVAVTPSTGTVAAGKTLQFAAAVSGTTNSAVTWTASAGTISSTGLFTAPATAQTVTITATSVASTSVSGTATVTVTGSAGGGIAVSVSPSTSTLTLGATEQFTAAVTGTTNTAVSWAATAGSISSTGLFTAPTSAGTVTITARSAADNTVAGLATVIVRNSGVSVRLATHPAFVGTGESYQFVASVTGSTNQSVTWNATGGTITSDGLFTAGVVPGSFSVTATSVADPTASISTPITVNVITVTISPSTVTLSELQTQQFSVKVSGAFQSGSTLVATGGTITAAGLYTAGSTAGTFAVTATSLASSSAKATATVTIVAPFNITYTFGGGAPSVFSPQTVSTSPSGAHYLGGFSGNSPAQLTLGNLPPHSSVTLSFDLYIIGNWAGLPTNGNFAVQFGGATAFSQTFSNISGDNQTYPNGGTNAPGTGLGSGDPLINSLGYSFTPAILYNDTVYHITLTDVDTSSSFVATFTGTLTGTIGTQSWGLNNVQVVTNP